MSNYINIVCCFFQKKVIFQKQVTMQVITATVTNVFISASKCKKNTTKALKNFKKRNFGLGNSLKIRDDIIDDDDVSTKMANMFI